MLTHTVSAAPALNTNNAVGFFIPAKKYRQPLKR